MPKVSIVFWANECADQVSKALQSVGEQTYQDWELRIIPYAGDNIPPSIASDARLRRPYSSNAQAPTWALAEAMARIEAPYVAFLDANYVWNKAFLERMLSVLDSNPEADVACCAIRRSQQSVIAPFAQIESPARSRLGTFQKVAQAEIPTSASLLFRTPLLKEIGPPSTEPRLQYAEHYDLWLRAARRADFAILLSPLVENLGPETDPASLRQNAAIQRKIVEVLCRTYHELKTEVDSPQEFRQVIETELERRWKRLVEMYACRAFFAKIARVMFAPFCPRPTLAARWCAQAFVERTRNRIRRGWAIRRTLRGIGKSLMKMGETRRELRAIFQRLERVDLTEDKIDVLCMLHWRVVGGAEKLILDLGRQLDRERFRLHLVADLPDVEEWREAFDATFCTVTTPGKMPYFLFTRLLKRLIQRLNIKVALSSHSQVFCDFAPELRAAFPSVRTVDIIHLELSTGIQPGHAWLPSYLDARICISEQIRDYLANLYDVEYCCASGLAQRLRVIYNGIDVNQFRRDAAAGRAFRERHGIPPDAEVVLFLARLAHEKRPLLFLQIAEEYLKRKPDAAVRFVMAGDGPLREETLAEVKTLGLGARFIWVGMQADVKPALSAAKVLLVTSEHEGIPYGAIEAMAMDVPVISARVGGVAEAIRHGENGFLIESGAKCADDFVKTLDDVLSQPGLYDRLSVACRSSVVERFSFERMRIDYERFFNELLIGPSIAQDVLVSVVMPVFNGARYLRRAVESILSQTYRHLELIIIDDGSTDASLALLRDYEAKDLRIRLISRANKGVAATLREGVAMARGALVARMDADDVAMPMRIAKQVAFLQEHPETVCVSCSIAIIDEEDRFLFVWDYPPDDETIQRSLLSGVNIISHPGVMFRRDVYEQVGGYLLETDLAEDMDLWLRMGEVGRLAIIPSTLIFYREHSASICAKNPDRQVATTREVCERAYKRRGINGNFKLRRARPHFARSGRAIHLCYVGKRAYLYRQHRVALTYALKTLRVAPWLPGGWRLLLLSLCAYAREQLRST